MPCPAQTCTRMCGIMPCPTQAMYKNVRHYALSYANNVQECAALCLVLRKQCIRRCGIMPCPSQTMYIKGAALCPVLRKQCLKKLRHYALSCAYNVLECAALCLVLRKQCIRRCGAVELRRSFPCKFVYFIKMKISCKKPDLYSFSRTWFAALSPNILSSFTLKKNILCILRNVSSRIFLNAHTDQICLHYLTLIN